MSDTTPIPAPELNVAVQAAPAEKTVEYVSAGGWRHGWGSTAELLSQSADDAQQAYGDQLYEEMRTDHAVSSPIEVLKYGVFSGEACVRPAVEPPPGKRPDDPEIVARQAEYDAAREIAEFCEWDLAQMARPFPEFLREMTDALLLCTKLAEKVYAVETTGEYAGYLRHARLPVKPRTSWAFYVDGARNVLGVRASALDAGGTVTLSREKFAVLTWDPRDNDPRGNSLARPAYKPWEIRIRLWKEWFRYLQQFSRPIPVGYVPADSEPTTTVTVDDDGTETDGSGEESPEQAYLKRLVQARNGAALVWPAAGRVEYLLPPGDGKVFLEAFDSTQRQCVGAVMHQIRTIVESKFGSRADSGTAADILTMILGYLRGWVERFVEWELFYPLVTYNFGPEVAARYTPKFSLGDVTPKDVAKLGSMFAGLGYKLAESHLPVADAQLGFPPRGPDDAMLGNSSGTPKSSPPDATNDPESPDGSTDTADDGDA